MAKVIGALSTKPYIRHFSSSKGLGKTLVFRPNDKTTRNLLLKAAFLMQSNTGKYYYDNTGWKWVNTVKKNKASTLLAPNAIGKTHVTSLAFVVAVCRFAGITKATSCNSFGALRDKLENATKLTKQRKVASQVTLKPGDILIRPKSSSMKGYGCIYVGNTKRTSVLPSKSSGSSGTNKETKKKDLGEFAKGLCWPSVKGNSNPKGEYPNGKRTVAYDAAYKAIKSKLKIKDKRYQVGASCDVFVFAACRAYGIDNFPNRLSAQCEYFFKSDKYKTYFTKVQTDKGSTAKMKSGDVVCRINSGSKNNGQGHILIVCVENGKKRTANAHHEKKHNGVKGYYGVVDGFSSKDTNKASGKNKYYGVFRLKPGVALGDGTVAGASGDSSDSVVVMDDGSALVLDTINTLFSSQGYDWAKAEEKKESESDKFARETTDDIRNFLDNLKIDQSNFTYAPPADVQVMSSMKASNKAVYKTELYKGKSGGNKLTSYPNMVQAPIIELSFNGTIIGGYGNVGDEFPNYINSLQVQKVNGRINRYTIGLSYQVRPGEDPNFIDGLLGKVGYTNPLKIRYGDGTSPGLIFREDSAVVTDVKHKEDVASSSITYTISAISSIASANTSSFTFAPTVDRPSNVINNLLYGKNIVSKQLRDAFPAMTNKTFVSSNNLIPTTDSVISIGGMNNTSPLTYLSHLVSCMSNKGSSFFLTFHDGKDGAYFKITEVKKQTSSQVAGLYEIDVGYPGDNFVTNFQLCNNIYWPLVYEYNGNVPKYNYDIDSNGSIFSSSSNRLLSDNKFLADSVINENWWSSITEFPVSAKITLKGLTAPVMLMTYIKVNTLFYGQKDMASGLYVVTDQEDSVSGNGCSTTLTMLRVGE